jgi:hypothetical protein
VNDDTTTTWARDLSDALRILNSWKCSALEVETILGRSPLEAESAGEVPDCADRIYGIIGIDETLRIAFNNPVNINGFVRMPNGNGVFNGRKPIDMMDSTAGIKDVLRALSGTWRGGPW